MAVNKVSRTITEQIALLKTRGMLIKDELLALWLADQVTAVVADEKDIADKALKIAQQTVKQKPVSNKD